MRRAIVLMYHRLGSGRVDDRPADEGLYAIEPAIFAAHLDVILKGQCTLIDATTLAAAISDAAAMPERAVHITFDDGNASDVVAAELLAARGLTATFFISPALIGAPGYLTWREVAALVAVGMTVGVHGLDHTHLDTLAGAELADHLRAARDLIARHLGAGVRPFSLPGGAGADARVHRACADAGFRPVFDSTPRRVRPRADSTLVPRFAVRRADSLAEFEGLVRQRRMALVKRGLRHGALRCLRRGLGETGYARLRHRLTERRGEGGE